MILCSARILRISELCQSPCEILCSDRNPKKMPSSETPAYTTSSDGSSRGSSVEKSHNSSSNSNSNSTNISDKVEEELSKLWDSGQEWILIFDNLLKHPGGKVSKGCQCDMCEMNRPLLHHGGLPIDVPIHVKTPLNSPEDKPGSCQQHNPIYLQNGINGRGGKTRSRSGAASPNPDYLLYSNGTVFDLFSFLPASHVMPWSL